MGDAHPAFGLSEVSCFDRIWETSAPNNPHFLHALQEQLNALRSMVVLGTSYRNIINPYLYPLVYGRTLVRSLSGDVVPVQRPPFAQINYTISSDFACLPTLFSVSHDPDPLTVSALSYINGVPPWQHGLYRSLEGALAASIPLFEHVLTDLHRSNLLSHRIPGTCKYTTWDEPLTPENSDDEEGWTVYQREMNAWTMSRPIQYPDVPEEGYTGGLERRKFKASLRGRNVKVILKVTDISLVSSLAFQSSARRSLQVLLAPGPSGLRWHTLARRGHEERAYRSVRGTLHLDGTPDRYLRLTPHHTESLVRSQM